MKTHRLARVAEAVREVASETILFELRDPRVKGVTVTRAEVSGDLQHAKVYVSIMGTPKEQDLCMHGLRHAAGFVQSKLAGRLQTRFTPVIQFVLDRGVKKSIEMTRLINEALGRPGPGATPADGTAEEQVDDEESGIRNQESGVRGQGSESGERDINPGSLHSDS
ncbi:MAG TPA: 30S ribosome-binding factor RbfA [Gemmataceae bacterium]|nr:30S ribosome-binding factor RbfA [Gemmataceae bacterium]